MQISEISFDVVIPMYNSEFTILRTLQSVVSQSIQPRKIIVIDDGSTDSSYEKVYEYIKHAPSIILIKSENQGRSAARNLGVTYCDADYVAFIDSDDEWISDRLKRARDVIGATKAQAYASGYLLRKDNQIFHGRRNRKRAAPSFNNLLYQLAFIPGSASSAIIARKIISNMKLFPENRSHGEDLEAWCKVASLTNWTIDEYETVIINQNTVKSHLSNKSSFQTQLANLSCYPGRKNSFASQVSLLYARSIDSRRELILELTSLRNAKRKIFSSNRAVWLTILGKLIINFLIALVGLIIYIAYRFKYGSVKRESRILDERSS
jgi:glycosyltransferase involved in cell wall biosynthesis